MLSVIRKRSFLRSASARAEMFSQTLAITRRVMGPENPQTCTFLSDFASMYQRQGKYALAQTYAAQALAGQRHTLGSAHPGRRHRRLTWHWHIFRRESSPRAKLSPARPWSSIGKSSRTTGSYSGLKAWWAPAWRDRRNTLKPNRCSWKATAG